MHAYPYIRVYKFIRHIESNTCASDKIQVLKCCYDDSGRLVATTYVLDVCLCRVCVCLCALFVQYHVWLCVLSVYFKHVKVFYQVCVCVTRIVCRPERNIHIPHICYGNVLGAQRSAQRRAARRAIVSIVRRVVCHNINPRSTHKTQEAAPRRAECKQAKSAQSTQLIPTTTTTTFAHTTQFSPSPIVLRVECVVPRESRLLLCVNRVEPQSRRTSRNYSRFKHRLKFIYSWSK